MKNKTEFDWNFSVETGSPEIGICKATHQAGDYKIIRKFKLAENGELITRLEYYLENKKVFYTNNKYDFDECFSGNPRRWIKANHNADPEVEFEDLKSKISEYSPNNL